MSHPEHGCDPVGSSTLPASRITGMSQADAEALTSAIPPDELPDAADRAALVAALVAGEVEDVYRPFGATYHNVTIPVPPWVDPRLRVREWAQLRRGRSTSAMVALLIVEANGQTARELLELRQVSQEQESREMRGGR